MHLLRVRLVLLLAAACAAAAGCGRPASDDEAPGGVTGGGAALDYGYAAETPEEEMAARERFGRAVRAFEAAQLRVTTNAATETQVRAVLKGEAAEGTLEFRLPGNGMATIAVTLGHESADPAVQRRHEELLRTVEDILNPQRPAEIPRERPSDPLNP